MPVSSTLHIIENPIRNPNAEQGNKNIKNIVCDTPENASIILGANIIATMADITTVNPKIILIAFIYLIF